jgi:PAS domain-containing protein
VHIISDITERKRADEALRESEERYRLLIERQKDGLCIVDLEEGFVFCNPAGEEVFGVPHGNVKLTPGASG